MKLNFIYPLHPNTKLFQPIWKPTSQEQQTVLGGGGVENEIHIYFGNDCLKIREKNEKESYLLVHNQNFIKVFRLCIQMCQTV